MISILGINVTAYWYCACYKNGKKRQNWSATSYIPGTKTRVGNVAIVASAQVAPISYPNLASMFSSARMPSMGRWSFDMHSRNYVWPAIEEKYTHQQLALIQNLTEPISISLDGQYDSPGWIFVLMVKFWLGFCAEMCAVTAIEQESNQVLEFAVAHKSEVEGISNRMELHGIF